MSYKPPLSKGERQDIVRAYLSGMTLREVARTVDRSMQRIHQIIREDAPSRMRKPYVGKRQQGLVA